MNGVVSCARKGQAPHLTSYNPLMVAKRPPAAQRDFRPKVTRLIRSSDLRLERRRWSWKGGSGYGKSFGPVLKRGKHVQTLETCWTNHTLYLFFCGWQLGAWCFAPISSTFLGVERLVLAVMIWGHAEDRPEDRSNCRGQFEAWGTAGPEGSHMLNQ